MTMTKSAWLQSVVLLTAITTESEPKKMKKCAGFILKKLHKKILPRPLIFWDGLKREKISQRLLNIILARLTKIM